MSEHLTPEEVHDAVDQAVAELLDELGQAAPPVDAVGLARRLSLSIEPLRGRRHSPEGDSPEHPHWLAALAVAASRKPKLLARIGLPSERGPLAGASLTDLFARRLLVPAGWFRDEARALGHDLFLLKDRFATANYELIAWRLLDLPEPCVITLVDNGKVTRRKSNAWRVTGELSRAERSCQEYVSLYSRPREVDEGGWHVRGWPVHRADWKREVLRSVVEEGVLE